MTLEKAAELIVQLDGTEKQELFEFYVRRFDLDGDRLKMFASMCDFPFAEGVLACV